MNSEKDNLQTNGIHSEQQSAEPSTSGRLSSADDNANVNTRTNNHKGAIPKVKTNPKRKFTSLQKKSAKLNNNIGDEPKSLVAVSDLLKMNGHANGSTSYLEGHFEPNSIDHCDSLTDSPLDDREDNLLESGLLINMMNQQLLSDNPISCVDKLEHYDCSSDDDLFSVSDDGCIYTYKGDNTADLPSSFFNLNLPPHAATCAAQQMKPNREQSSSPEMDFLEMDFDPGPPDELTSHTDDKLHNGDTTISDNSNSKINGVHVSKDKKCDSKESSTRQETNTEICSSNELSQKLKQNSAVACHKKDISLPLNRKPKDVATECHKLLPWFCPVTQRTAGRSTKHIKRCHTTGELMSPSEKITPDVLLFKMCEKTASPAGIEEVMIWSETEARVKQINQIGPSACGATAVLNVLNALRLPIPTLEKIEECLNTKLRASQNSPLTEYLLSRSVAGTNHEDLIEGLRKLSDDQIDARFFHMYPERVLNLYTWLGFWMKNGAVPIATLNLQKGKTASGTIPDAWHHQMIYGVGPKGIYLTNPLECVLAEHLWPLLCSESVLLIRRDDVLKRWNIATDFPQLVRISDPRWRKINVVGQVANMINESRRELRRGFINTSHIRIPAAYSSGITLVMRVDAPAYALLKQCPELLELTTSSSNVSTPQA